jgi:hypothetical protein
VTKLKYEVAPVQESLSAAQGILQDLYRLTLAVLGEGVCEDCEQEQTLLEYGRVRVCRPCADRRKRASERAAA